MSWLTPFCTAPGLSVGQCAELACLLEVTARKPGNVHRGADFEDVRYVDFVVSAVAIAPALNQAEELGVGPTVRECIRRTRDLVGSNTNLGIVLLLAPLAAVPSDQRLAAGIGAVLERLTIADAQAVYEAIRLARPGGLGHVPEQDVAGEPTEHLRSVMQRASQRDLIARQYVNGFQEVFHVGLPILTSPQIESANWEEAIILCHLELMARHPDTLIARKRGELEAAEAARRAADVLVAGWPRADDSRRRFAELDAWLRAVGHERNPGTTADLVTASLFAALREGRALKVETLRH
jgi:triphosphoribosyl-dephospho-CoA synthase